MTTGTDDKILKRLEKWEKKEGSLPKALEFYRGLLGIQSRAKSRICVPKLSLTEKTISNRLSHGSPILRFDDLSIDWSLLGSILEEVTAFFASYSADLGEVPENLKHLGSRLPLLKEATRAWFEGTPFPPQIMDSGVNEVLLDHIIHASLRPFLINHREALISFVDRERWRRGFCPICGGNPDFAYLDKEPGARWLLCSRCDAEWLFQRLECPSCGTHDQNALAYFTDEEGLYRLYVCEQCRHYLKAIDLRVTESEVLLPLERFLTIDMDNQAQKKGYSPSSSAPR